MLEVSLYSKSPGLYLVCIRPLIVGNSHVGVYAVEIRPLIVGNSHVGVVIGDGQYGSILWFFQSSRNNQDASLACFVDAVWVPFYGTSIIVLGISTHSVGTLGPLECTPPP